MAITCELTIHPGNELRVVMDHHNDHPPFSVAHLQGTDAIRPVVSIFLHDPREISAWAALADALAAHDVKEPV